MKALSVALSAAGVAGLIVGFAGFRRWHLRWGARDEEIAARLQGDDLVPSAQFTANRVIEINAPPAEVWPWLVQVGFGRADFYSYDLLDNLGRRSAEVILPEWQEVHVGDLAAPMSNPPTETTSFTVRSVETGRYLVWSKPDSTWVWVLDPLDGGRRTRLRVRLKQRYDWRRPVALAVTVILSEFGDFLMMRRMLHGIRRRAEAAASRDRSRDTPMQ
ncbi:MAG: hypothetical protein ACXV5Q_02245 [Frankiaceae bacterium]